MDGYGYFFSNQTMNCQIIVFLLKKIHSSLLICNQFCLGCSGEWFSYHKIRESGGGGGGSEKKLISIFLPQLQRGLMQFWKL